MGGRATRGKDRVSGEEKRVRGGGEQISVLPLPEGLEP